MLCKVRGDHLRPISEITTCFVKLASSSIESFHCFPSFTLKPFRINFSLKNIRQFVFGSSLLIYANHHHATTELPIAPTMCLVICQLTQLNALLGGPINSSPLSRSSFTNRRLFAERDGREQLRLVFSQAVSPPEPGA